MPLFTVSASSLLIFYFMNFIFSRVLIPNFESSKKIAATINVQKKGNILLRRMYKSVFCAILTGSFWSFLQTRHLHLIQAAIKRQILNMTECCVARKPIYVAVGPGKTCFPVRYITLWYCLVSFKFSKCCRTHYLLPKRNWLYIF